MKRWQVCKGRGDYGASVRDADGHLVADVEQEYYARLIVQAFNAQLKEKAKAKREAKAVCK